MCYIRRHFDRGGGGVLSIMEKLLIAEVHGIKLASNFAGSLL